MLYRGRRVHGPVEKQSVMSLAYDDSNCGGEVGGAGGGGEGGVGGVWGGGGWGGGRGGDLTIDMQ